MFELGYIFIYKMLANEMSEWGKSLNESQIKELNKKLTDTFGADLTSAKVFEKIESIINKGKISSLKVLTNGKQEIFSYPALP